MHAQFQADWFWSFGGFMVLELWRRHTDTDTDTDKHTLPFISVDELIVFTTRNPLPSLFLGTGNRFFTGLESGG